MDVFKRLFCAVFLTIFGYSGAAYADEYMEKVCSAYEDPDEVAACLNPAPKSKPLPLPIEEKPAVKMCGDISCDNYKLWRAAEDHCPEHIERLTKHRYEWTSGNLGMKFQMQAFDTDMDNVKRMTGYRLKIQDDAGRWSESGYYCDIDATTGKVVNFGLGEG